MSRLLLFCAGVSVGFLAVGAAAVYGLDRVLNFQHAFDPMLPPEGWRFR